MADNQVRIDLNAQGNLINILNQAQKLTGELESKVERLKGVFNTLGMGLGAFAGLNFLKQSLEYYTKIQQEQAGLEVILKNQNNLSKERLDILKRQRDELRLQGIENDKLIKAQAEIAAKYPKGSLILQKKLLQTAADVNMEDPASAVNSIVALMAKGSTKGKLKEVPGVIEDLNKIRELNQQFKVVTDINQRQLLILKAIQEEKRGMFEAKDAADPLDEFKDSLTLLQEQLGEVIGVLAKYIAPHLANFANMIKDLVSNHMTLIKNSLVIIYESFKAMATYFVAKKITETIANGIEGFKKFLNVFKKGAIEDAIKPKEMIINAGTVIINDRGQSSESSLLGGGRSSGAMTRMQKINAGIGRAAPGLVAVGAGLSMAQGLATPGSATEATLDYASAGLQGAGYGAMLGSVIPVVGSAVGAAVGGAIGLGMTWWKRTTKATEDINAKTIDQRNAGIKQINENLVLGLAKAKTKAEATAAQETFVKTMFPSNVGGTLLGGGKLSESDAAASKKILEGIDHKLLTQIGGDEDARAELYRLVKAGETTQTALNFLKMKGYISGTKGDTGISTGIKGEGAAAKVSGVQPKIININIHDGLINHFTQKYDSVKESAADVERIVTQAILNGLHAGEMMLGGS